MKVPSVVSAFIFALSVLLVGNEAQCQIAYGSEDARPVIPRLKTIYGTIEGLEVPLNRFNGVDLEETNPEISKFFPPVKNGPGDYSDVIGKVLIAEKFSRFRDTPPDHLWVCLRRNTAISKPVAAEKILYRRIDVGFSELRIGQSVEAKLVGPVPNSPAYACKVLAEDFAILSPPPKEKPIPASPTEPHPKGFRGTVISVRKGYNNADSTGEITGMVLARDASGSATNIALSSATALTMTTANGRFVASLSDLKVGDLIWADFQGGFIRLSNPGGADAVRLEVDLPALPH